MVRSVLLNAKITRLCMILSLALVVTSCASVASPEQKSMGGLRLSVDAFNNAFRWGDYSEAAPLVTPEKKQQFWADADQIKSNIRISDYELRALDYKDKQTSATATVRFQFWRPESPILQNVTFTQKWYYTEKDKMWRVSETGFNALSRGEAVHFTPGQ